MKETKDTFDTARQCSAGVIKATILVVEDDVQVGEMICAMLKRIGFTVLTADTPRKALQLCEDTDRPIDLLLTDVAMPEMNGMELRERVGMIRPDIRTILMSGYTLEAMVDHGAVEKEVYFIQKPFGVNELVQKICTVMTGCRKTSPPDGTDLHTTYPAL